MINRYPYTDAHELNLDYILKKMKELSIEFDQFKVLNEIKFVGVWDITENYPKWSIVTNGDTGYLSIDIVPAGIDINNTDYWVKIFDYSEEFNKVETLVNKRYIFIGDSYEGTSNWGETLAADLGMNSTFSQVNVQLKKNADNTVYIASYGGMGFTNTGSGADPDVNGFLSLLQNAYPYIENYDTITDIVVLGGANDAFWAMTDAYVTAHMDDFADYAEEKFTAAKLWLGFIARIRGTNPSNIVFKDILTAYYNYSSSKRFTYMHGIESSLYIVDSLLRADNLHPDVAGGNIIAKNAAQIIKNGNCVNIWNGIDLPSTVVIDNGTSDTGINFKQVLVDGNTKHFDVDIFNWRPTNSAIAGDFTLTIGHHGIFYANKPIYVPVTGYAIQTGIGIINLNLCIVLDGYDVKLRGNFPESVTSFTTHNSIVAITVNPFSFDVPALYL